MYICIYIWFLSRPDLRITLHTADAPFCRRGQWYVAQQQAREKETHGRQRCWAGGILGPGAACGGAPRTLGRASAAGTSSRRPTKPACAFLGVHMQGCFYGQRDPHTNSHRRHRASLGLWQCGHRGLLPDVAAAAACRCLVAATIAVTTALHSAASQWPPRRPRTQTTSHGGGGTLSMTLSSMALTMDL